MKARKLFMSTFAAGLCSVVGFADDATMVVETIMPDAAVETVQEDTYDVTFEFVDTRIQDVLSIMAEQRPNTSILVGPEVQGNVTLNLKRVPWIKALDLILKQHGLEYEKVSENIFQIKVSTASEVVAKADVKVELYEMSEIVNMDSKELYKLYSKLADARADVTTEQMRAHIIENGKIFIKQLEADNQQAVKILKVLANNADLNFSFSGIDSSPVAKNDQIAPSPFKNKVSMRLRRMPLEKVLTMVCNKGGLSCLYKDDVWEISPRRPEQQRPLVIGHFQIKFMAIDKTLLDVLRSLVSERGKITAGKNKTLIVKATEEEQEAIRNTLAVMDKPTPQVMIEARFFELADGESSYIGVDWSAALGETGTTFGASGQTTFRDTMWTPNNTVDRITDYKQIPGTTDSDITAWKQDQITQNGSWSPADLLQTFYLPEITYGAKDTPASSSYEGLNRVSTATMTYTGFAATLRALEADDGSEQLANPKIVVTSGEQATIHIGSKVPIFKASSSGSGESAERTYELDSNFGSEETNRIANLTGEEGDIQDVFNAQGTPGYLDLGTILTVAPTVKTDDQVYIKVIPNLMKVTGKVETADGTSYPTLFSTKVYTEFTINSGQTIAIGGLTKEEELTNINKVPLLGDIPLIGKYLFSYESTNKQRSESVIFLTVNVVGAKDLKTTSGIPINSRLVDPVLETIRLQDAQGAEYIPQSLRNIEQEIVPAEEAPIEGAVEEDKVEEVEEVKQEEEIEPVVATEEEVIVIE